MSHDVAIHSIARTLHRKQCNLASHGFGRLEAADRHGSSPWGQTCTALVLSLAVEPAQLNDHSAICNVPSCTYMPYLIVFVDMCDLFACMVCCDLLWKSDASNMLLRLHENMFPFFFHSFTINCCLVLTAKTWSGFAHVVLQQVLFINSGKVFFRLTARIELSWGPHRPCYLHTLSALVIPLNLNLEWFA